MNNATDDTYAGDYSVTVQDDGALIIQELDVLVIDLEAVQAD